MLVHVSGLRPGHEWADDYAMYVAHAQNLLAGRPYADTGFIPNPWSVPGPPTYPPVYPLLIVPMVAAWGADLQALKVFGVLMLGAALLVAYAIWRPRTGVGPALALVVLFGLSPYLAAFRDEVRPDTAFLFLFLATLWLGDRWTGHLHGWDRGALQRGIALGLVAYLAYGTRSLGLVLLPALWLVELWRLRRPTPTLMIASAVCALAVVLQAALLHTDSAYAGNLTLDPGTLAYNARHYFTSLSVLWLNPLPAPWDMRLRALLFGASLLLAAIGYVACLRRGVSVFEIVPWLYFAPLVLYWVGSMIQQRYVLPLFPLLLYHAWIGADVLRQRLGRAVVLGLLSAFGVAAGVAYGSGNLLADHSEIRPGAMDADARTVYGWLRERTPADAVVLVGRARAFALNTGRAGVSPFGFRSDEELWGLIAAKRVTHMVVGLGEVARDMDYEHPDDLGRFAAANPGRLTPVLQTSTLVVYQVDGRAAR